MRKLLPAVLVVSIVLVLILARGAIPPPPPAALGAIGHGPTVVLLHGLGSNAEHWLPMARDLARDHRVVFVELPGHGEARMPAPLTLEEAALQLDRAIAEQGDAPVVLVGHSVGGLVAAAEALHAPQRVRALVLVESALRPQIGPDDLDALMRSLEQDYAGTLHEHYVSFGRDSAQGERLFAEAMRVEPSVVKAWIRLASTTDLSGAVARLRVPTLVVLGERSWPEGERWTSCADTLGYGKAPGVTPMRMSGVGHFLMLDRPHDLADAIRRFTRTGPSAAVAMR